MTTESCNFRDQGLYHLVKRVDQSAWGEVRASCWLLLLLAAGSGRLWLLWWETDY